MDQGAGLGEIKSVLTADEIANLSVEGGQSAETLMNVVALIAKRFRTDVCSAYLLEPDRRQPGVGGHRRAAAGVRRQLAHGGA